MFAVFFHTREINEVLRGMWKAVNIKLTLNFRKIQVKPYNIYVTVAYPPDTDTPGFAEESKTKVNHSSVIL